MSQFPWMDSKPTTRPGSTAATRDDEVRRRAKLLAGLGYTRAAAEKRLRANVEWEHERLGKASVLGRLPALVAEAYQRAGVRPTTPEPAPRSKKKRA